MNLGYWFAVKEGKEFLGRDLIDIASHLLPGKISANLKPGSKTFPLATVGNEEAPGNLLFSLVCGLLRTTEVACLEALKKLIQRR